MSKKVYILKNDTVCVHDRSNYEIQGTLLYECIIIDSKHIKVYMFHNRQWFRTKKVAVAYAEYLMEKKLGALERRIVNLRNKGIKIVV